MFSEMEDGKTLLLIEPCVRQDFENSPSEIFLLLSLEAVDWIL